MKKIMALTVGIILTFTLTSCDPMTGELTTLNPLAKIKVLSLIDQLTPRDVMKTCNIKRGDKRATSLYNTQLACLRTLADKGNIIPMFTVANTDMTIYNKTNNPKALTEARLYLKIIIAFSRMPEFDFNNILPEDRITHKRNLQQLIHMANVASQLLFKHKNAKQAQTLEREINILKRHIKVIKLIANNSAYD